MKQPYFLATGHKRADLKEPSHSRQHLPRLLALVGLVASLLWLGMAQAASQVGNGPCPAARRAINLASPAVVRVATTFQAQLIYYNLDGSSVQFPLGGGSYQITITGSGAFLAASGDVITAYQVVGLSSTEQSALLAERAAPDIAQALNSAHPSQTVTPADILTILMTDSNIWQGTYGQAQTLVYLSSHYTGPATVNSLTDLRGYPVTTTAQSSPDQPTFNDLALLHVVGLADMPIIPLGDSDQVTPGDSLTILGYPDSADLAASDGTIAPTNFITPSLETVTVSALKTAADDSQVIQVNGQLEQGEGGAPALNAEGQLVGIVSLAASGSSDTGQSSFLHTANAVKPLLQSAEIHAGGGAFQKKWSAAYDACASTAPGHWHTALTQYKQLARQYPDFKGVQPYLDYTTSQAAHEPLPTQNQGSLLGVILALLALLALAGGVLLLLRRRRKKQASTGTFVGVGPGLNESQVPAP